VSSVDFVIVAVRALSFLAVLQAAGSTLFLWLFADEIDGARQRISTFSGRAALAGLVLTLAYQALLPTQLTGTLAGALDGGLQAALWGSDPGTATAVRTLGLILLLPAWRSWTRSSSAAALAGGTLIAVSFALIGHTTHDPRRWILAVLLISHVMAVTFWFGALVPLHIVNQRESAASAVRLIDSFSRLATRLVPCLFVAGLAMSAALLPSLASLGTAYGALLLTKIAGFAILMMLASLNKWRLAPLIGTGDADARRAFRRSVLAEWLLIAGVLSVTATMTALFSPGHE
jgi:putative copper export protein